MSREILQLLFTTGALVWAICFACTLLEAKHRRGLKFYDAIGWSVVSVTIVAALYNFYTLMTAIPVLVK